MADIPLVRIPTGQSTAVTMAITGLLCAVLGAVQVVDGLVTAGADEAAVLTHLIAAAGTVTAVAATEFEQARWAAASA